MKLVMPNAPLHCNRDNHYDCKVKKVANGFVPIIPLDRAAAKPLHRQIYDVYRANIAGRKLRPGERVLSSRDLALQLGISRVPVLTAYAQLLAEGYLESRSGSGTFVSHSMSEPLTSRERNARPTKTCSGPRPVSRRSALLPAFKRAPWLSGWGRLLWVSRLLSIFPFRFGPG